MGSAEAHHRLEQGTLPLLDILTHGVQVRRELHAGGEEPLVFLALGLAVQLLPPLRHEPEAGLIGRQHLDLLAGAVQLIPGGGILPGGVFRHVRLGADLHHSLGTLHQLADIHPRHGDGQQAHSGEDTVPAADVVRHHEGLVARLIRQSLQRPLAAVGGGVDAPGRLLWAVPLLQQLPEETEGHRRLRGGAGLGDDVDGEVHPLQQVHKLRHLVGGQAVAGEVDVGGVLLFQVIVGGAQALDDAPCAQIGAADADDHQRLRVLLNFSGRRLNAGELLPVILPGQLHPAGELAACAVTVLQMTVGQPQLGGTGLLVGQRDKLPDMGQIHLYHIRCLLCTIWFIIQRFPVEYKRKPTQKRLSAGKKCRRQHPAQHGAEGETLHALRRPDGDGLHRLAGGIRQRQSPQFLPGGHRGLHLFRQCDGLGQTPGLTFL